MMKQAGFAVVSNPMISDNKSVLRAEYRSSAL